MRRYLGAEARALREAATDGPWVRHNYGLAGNAVAQASAPSYLIVGDCAADDAPLIAAAPDLAATVEALEAELAEARLCLLAEAGDPRGAEGLHPGWRRVRPQDAIVWCIEVAPFTVVARLIRKALDPGFRYEHDFRWADVPAGLTIREAMRWVEREVGL